MMFFSYLAILKLVVYVGCQACLVCYVIPTIFMFEAKEHIFPAILGIGSRKSRDHDSYSCEPSSCVTKDFIHPSLKLVSSRWFHSSNMISLNEDNGICRPRQWMLRAHFLTKTFWGLKPTAERKDRSTLGLEPTHERPTIKVQNCTTRSPLSSNSYPTLDLLKGPIFHHFSL